MPEMKSKPGMNTPKVRQTNAAPKEAADILKAVVSAFLLLREQGYQLRVLPAPATENTPVFNFEQNEPMRPAA